MLAVLSAPPSPLIVWLGQMCPPVYPFRPHAPSVQTPTHKFCARGSSPERDSPQLFREKRCASMGGRGLLICVFLFPLGRQVVQDRGGGAYQVST